MTTQDLTNNRDRIIRKINSQITRATTENTKAVTVEVSENYKIENVHRCPKAPSTEIPKKVKVTFCTALGKPFENLTPDSIHEVVMPPSGYKNDHTGVWVMGVGEPVKLLSKEFVSL